MKLDAIVLCGKSSYDDPLLKYMKESTDQVDVNNKALIKIANKEIIRHICDALNSSNSIRDIYLAGLKEKDIQFDYPVQYLDVEEEIPSISKVEYWIKNVLVKRDDWEENNCVLIVNGDIPTIAPEHVDWVVTKFAEKEADFHYIVVEKKDMDKVFPNAGRTFAKLKDGAFCGGDIFGINPLTIDQHKDKIRELQERRKSFIRQVLFVKPFQVLKILLRLATVQDVAKLASKSLKMSVHLVIAPYPELAMDIDKPYQFELVRSYLEKQ